MVKEDDGFLEARGVGCWKALEDDELVSLAASCIRRDDDGDSADWLMQGRSLDVFSDFAETKDFSLSDRGVCDRTGLPPSRVQPDVARKCILITVEDVLLLGMAFNRLWTRASREACLLHR